MKTKGKAWQLVVTVLLIAAFVYTAFFGVAVKYGDVTKTYIKGRRISALAWISRVVST